MGENPKMPYPMQKKAPKYLLSNNNDAPSTTKCGFLVQRDAQIAALRAHYTCSALKSPSYLALFAFVSRMTTTIKSLCAPVNMINYICDLEAPVLFFVGYCCRMQRRRVVLCCAVLCSKMM